MGTTINDLVDRQGGAYSEEELVNVLNQARKILADTCVLLDLEIETHFATDLEQLDEDKLKRLKSLIQQIQKGMQQILDVEIKTGLTLKVGGRDMDVEEAREEILRRIARIAV